MWTIFDICSLKRVSRMTTKGQPIAQKYGGIKKEIQTFSYTIKLKLSSYPEDMSGIWDENIWTVKCKLLGLILGNKRISKF